MPSLAHICLVAHLVIFLPWISCSQDTSLPDKPAKAVKRITTYHGNSLEGTLNWDKKTLEEYDRAGNQLKKLTFYSGSTYAGYVRLYRDDGRLLKQLYISARSTIDTNITDYHFDESGVETGYTYHQSRRHYDRAKHYYKDGLRYQTYIAEYKDSTLFRYKIKLFDTNGLHVESFVVQEYKGHRNRYTYNEKGGKLAQASFDKYDRPKGRWAFILDTRNRELERVNWNFNVRAEGAITLKPVELMERNPSRFDMLDFAKTLGDRLPSEEELNRLYFPLDTAWTDKGWELVFQDEFVYGNNDEWVIQVTTNSDFSSTKYEREFTFNKRGDWIYCTNKKNGEPDDPVKRVIEYLE